MRARLRRRRGAASSRRRASGPSRGTAGRAAPGRARPNSSGSEGTAPRGRAARQAGVPRDSTPRALRSKVTPSPFATICTAWLRLVGGVAWMRRAPESPAGGDTRIERPAPSGVDRPSSAIISSSAARECASGPRLRRAVGAAGQEDERLAQQHEAPRCRPRWQRQRNSSGGGGGGAPSARLSTDAPLLLAQHDASFGQPGAGRQQRGGTVGRHGRDDAERSSL